MTTQNAKYPEKQWKTISIVSQLVGLLISFSPHHGEDETTLQLKTAINIIFEGKTRYPDNKLISDIIVKGKDKKECLKNLAIQQKDIITRNQRIIKEELNNFQNQVFGALAEALHNISLIETGIVFNEFKKWLINIAEEITINKIKGQGLELSESEQLIFNKLNKELQKI